MKNFMLLLAMVSFLLATILSVFQKFDMAAYYMALSVSLELSHHHYPKG